MKQWPWEIYTVVAAVACVIGMPTFWEALLLDPSVGVWRPFYALLGAVLTGVGIYCFWRALRFYDRSRNVGGVVHP